MESLLEAEPYEVLNKSGSVYVVSEGGESFSVNPFQPSCFVSPQNRISLIRFSS